MIVRSDFKNLEETINSIQIQNFIYFENFVVYDNEKKNLMLIKQYIKKFNNIKIIGFLIFKIFKIKKCLFLSLKILINLFNIFSILNCKGLYAMFLKLTYILATKNALNELYNLIIRI